MNTSFILLVVLVTTIVQVQCNNETCTERYTIIPGPTPRDGRDGIQGVPGRTGDKGDRGDIGPTGPKGDPGNVTLTAEYLNRVSDTIIAKINESVIAELQNTIQMLNKTLTDRLLYLESQVFVTLCNITSANWRRIAYFDTTQGDSCPTGLRMVTNTTTTQAACGMNVTGGCTSLTFPSSGNYSKVCGRVRGYQYGHPDTFNLNPDINSAYVEGISITQGQPRKHLWTYAVGFSEQAIYACPCNGNGPFASVPTFVGDHYYCESGFIASFEQRVAWEDPLWDGNGCHTANNTCCDRFGFFYRNVTTSTDDIEVRWCSSLGYTEEDSPADQLEIWVM